MKRTNVKRLTLCALLTAIALTIFVAEAQIQLPIPLPGFRLGLANIVTVYAMFAMGPRDTLLILLSRIILGGLFAGGSTLPFSLAGGLCCYLSMLVLRRFLSLNQLWACGAIGAIFHNVGQCLMAIFVYRAKQLIFFYFPFIMITGITAGFFTGLAAQFLLSRLGDRFKMQ